MALHEHARVERDAEELAEITDALGLVLAAAIGEEDEGDAVGLEVGQSFGGVRQGSGGAEEDAVDTGGSESVMGDLYIGLDEQSGPTQMRMQRVGLSWGWC